MNSGSPHEDCDDIGKKAFKRISGANEEYYFKSNIPTRIERFRKRYGSMHRYWLLEILFDKNNMILTIQTNMRNCDPRVSKDMTSKSLKYASEANLRDLESQIDIATWPILSCREVDASTSYTAVMKLKAGFRRRKTLRH